MKRKYINRNHPDFTAEQREDGNYNLKKEGSYGYSIKVARDVEDSEDWVEQHNWYLEALKEFDESWKKESERMENAIWGNDNKPSDKYEEFFKTVLDNAEAVEAPAKTEKEEQKKEEFTVLEYKLDGLTWKIKDGVVSCDEVGSIYSFNISIVDFTEKDREITKVRRESDGEVFSVGDMISDNRRLNLIQEFYLDIDFKLGLGIVLVGDTPDISLNGIKKAYKVEDGYVCEGDTVYYFVSWADMGVESFNGEPLTKGMLKSVNDTPYGSKIYKNDPRKSSKTKEYEPTLNSYKDSANNAHTTKRKPQGILSVRVGDKKYKLEQEYKSSKIASFFTNGSDIWISLFCGEQYKL
tara:strand:- start:7766 stop:8821 length:1056 start_codon:yes stop_codon:yes gene_type:complete